MNTVYPYNNDETKKVQIEKMFDSVAGKYDFLNHFFSFGIDKLWRKRLVNHIKKVPNRNILDIATGTGDLAIAASHIKGTKITGVDLSEKMLEIAKEKINKKEIENISVQKGDAENLLFPNNMFDVVMVAFGIRNFEDLNKGLKQIYQVLKPGGLFIILEFSKPSIFPVKQLYKFYSGFFIPFFGRIFTKNKKAYKYLPESVNKFPEGKELVKILEDCGFSETSFIPLSLRICSLYRGKKP